MGFPLSAVQGFNLFFNLLLSLQGSACGGRVVILLFCPSYFLMETGLYWHFCQISLRADVDWALLLFSPERLSAWAPTPFVHPQSSETRGQSIRREPSGRPTY